MNVYARREWVGPLSVSGSGIMGWGGGGGGVGRKLEERRGSGIIRLVDSSYMEMGKCPSKVLRMVWMDRSVMYVCILFCRREIGDIYCILYTVCSLTHSLG